MSLCDFLKRASEAVGLPGYESEIARLAREAFRPFADEVRVDRLGNSIAKKRGEGADPRPKVMLAAHMDEIGLIVTKIEERGFLRFSSLGGVDPRVLPGLEVTVHGERPVEGVVGSKPPHVLDDEERKKAFKMDDLYIDLGMSEEEVRKVVHVGDVVSFAAGCHPCGEHLSGKSLDDRAGVAAIFECMVQLSRLRHVADVYAVATVQEEVGLRGATVSAFGIVPDIGLAIDVCHAHAIGLPEHKTSGMGKGPVLSLGPNVHPKVYELLEKVAKDNGIPVQTEVSPDTTGTDAWAMQVTRAGVATGVISIPLRYMHTAVEVVSPEDVRRAGRLAALFCAAVDAAFVGGLTCY